MQPITIVVSGPGHENLMRVQDQFYGLSSQYSFKNFYWPTDHVMFFLDYPENKMTANTVWNFLMTCHLG